jgi:hypothetical protein
MGAGKIETAMPAHPQVSAALTAEGPAQVFGIQNGGPAVPTHGLIIPGAARTGKTMVFAGVDKKPGFSIITSVNFLSWKSVTQSRSKLWICLWEFESSLGRQENPSIPPYPLV